MKALFTAALFFTPWLLAAAQPAPATLAQKSTNAPPALSTNKPTAKELMKGDSFTNSVEIVMVKISPTLWAGKFLVTQEEYQKVMGSNPSEFRGERNPVDSVSWNDVLGFCAKLSQMERKEEMLPEGFVYTLPTQAQWESLAAGANLSDAVTGQGTPRSGTAPVGSLGPNSFGLFDIRGNLWEFCLNPDDKPYRVLKGGAWNTSLEVNLRPEFRWYSTGPDDRKNYYGFRCVLVPDAGGTP
jgi:formylglycine-generating enzyme required for sulfatase activity